MKTLVLYVLASIGALTVMSGLVLAGCWIAAKRIARAQIKRQAKG